MKQKPYSCKQDPLYKAARDYVAAAERYSSINRSKETGSMRAILRARNRRHECQMALAYHVRIPTQ